MVVGELAHERDVVIIGGGPGGYHAAIRVTQLGRKVTVIEQEELGGVCLNKGCIPSKVFTHASERLKDTSQDAKLGIERENITFNLSSLLNYKNSKVSQLRQGVEALCKANKIEILKGTAFFLSEEKIGVENGDTYEVYKFKDAIIATGGRPYTPEYIPINEERIYHSFSITNINEIPEELVVYGSDYIALEMAMTFQTFGSKVTLILDEEKENFSFDASINRELTRQMKKEKITIIKGYRLAEVFTTETEVTLLLDGKKGTKTISCSHLFYSLGVLPNIERLGLERLPVEIQSGYIKTDSKQQTTSRHIYAVGDVTSGPALAVKAIKQGKTAADTIGGLNQETDLQYLPNVIRTSPPIGTVGLSEEEAVKQGFQVVTSEFSLGANGFATLVGKKDGLVKVIMEKESDILLGIHMIGYGAIELLSTGTLALEMVARDEDIKFPLYPHPSMNESLLEAVEALKDQAIHLPPKKEKVTQR
ncbi:dihydrolipoyl dehydrogenase [Bacillus sp. 31A1R]|uniref:Dihydrolipoyl dehydrogenase n=1 Tax=Robertmurraya mangrovi TaxID=3098077 RepID=A0ABU5J054_9BACI|nr:dihydrolipoyl dehydrogenase [Bacillus sp. 31A1R]MDZ5472776.1 dihydrolipoyl dehydrogenase [Bacillus sp. 31A1R]